MATLETAKGTDGKATRLNVHGIFLCAAVLVIMFCSCAVQHSDVTLLQAKELIDSDVPLTVIDVREASEYCDSAGHIPGALNYPWNSGILQKKYRQLPADSPILVVCRSGNRSNQAAAFLRSKGFSRIYDMLGGMRSWDWQTAACTDSDGIDDDMGNVGSVNDEDRPRP
ncbi:MAG: rhodanese-like domain-containing protein [Planctomycetota bacterium]